MRVVGPWGPIGAAATPQMFPLEKLAALDLSLWFENGARAAQALGQSQAAVSRQSRAVLGDLQLQLERGGPHRQLQGDLRLLEAEREVHQLARFRGFAPLRLDATYCSGPWFLLACPPGWLKGYSDLPGLQRPLQLLRDRVIDAWVGSYQPDLPPPDSPDWWVLDLVRQPVQLLAAPDHPLGAETRLTAGDLERFPSLALPDGWFPRTEAVLKAQGLWSDPVRLKRYDAASWEGRSADGVTMLYGQSLTEALQPGTVRLDWDLGLMTGEALVVRRDLVNEAPIQELAQQLLLRARQVAAQFDDVELAR